MSTNVAALNKKMFFVRIAAKLQCLFFVICTCSIRTSTQTMSCKESLSLQHSRAFILQQRGHGLESLQEHIDYTIRN